MPGQQGFFDALMDAAVDAIVIIDAMGNIQRFNASAQQMFGYSESEAIGRNVKLLMPEPHRTQHDTYIGRYLQTGRAAVIGSGREEFGRRRNGDVFPMRLSVGAARLGEAVHFVGIIHDRTQQRETEGKLRELEQQLFHADRLVMLGELTAGIAHEINQPLTAIAAYGDAGCRLADPQGDAPSADLNTICQRISEQARRAAAVVERLRRLVRSGSANKSAHNINQIVNNTLLLFDYELKKSGITLFFDADECHPTVFVDEIQIQQILVNLIKNGIDAVRESALLDGRIVIRITHDAQALMVAVEDNGPGVASAAQARLFEPFYTSKPKGVGLGLSICKSIAAAHGGQLTYSRPTAGGCRFTLTLPLGSIG